MSDEIWVINASPLILLGKLGRTDLLESLARQVIVPQAVFREVAAGVAQSGRVDDVRLDLYTGEYFAKMNDGWPIRYG